MTSPQTITLTRPDDFHLHIRDADIMQAVLPFTASVFARAIIMPNLKQPITTGKLAEAYRKRILKALAQGGFTDSFTPLMTAYLTDESDADDIVQAYKDGILTAVKMYPARATTNAEFGLTDFFKPKALYRAMSDVGMPLLIHGELSAPDVDIYDRERLFIDDVLKRLTADYPDLKIVLEHITTREAVDFIGGGDNGDNIAATITPHHLRINRSDMFVGGRVRPHLFCLPIAKREAHRLALVEAAISGDKHFFAGTDSAPHLHSDKESACGCAGIFNAPTALETYAEVFESQSALDKLEAFMSFYGADFYGLPRNQESVTLKKQPYKFNDSISISKNKKIIPFRAGEIINWQIA